MPMSRRKQRNPKPAKREPIDFDQVVSELHLPSSHLYLREFGGESLVLAKQHLKAGTVLGKYRGGLKNLEEKDNTLIKVNRSDGGSPVHVMLENEGHWLKLMRTAALPTDANICLRISGEEIVCKVTKDVNKEVELKVICRIVDEKSLEQTELKTKNCKDQLSEKDCDLEIRKRLLEDKEILSSDFKIAKDMLDLVVKKSSSCADDMNSRSFERNENAENRRPKSNEDSDVDMKQDEVSSSSFPRVPSCENQVIHRSQSSDHSDRESCEGFSKDDVKPRDQSISLNHPKDEKAYKCVHCNYITMDTSTLNKHALSHLNQNSKRACTKVTNAKSFCEACKIQFMSVDTYRVHKQLYCKSRHERDEDLPSPPLASETPSVSFKPGTETVIIRSGGSGSASTSSLIQPQAIYAAISTNPLILLPCSLVNGQGLVPQAGVLSNSQTGIVLQRGIACPTIVEKAPKTDYPPPRKTSHPIMNFNTDSMEDGSVPLRKRKMSEGDVLNSKKMCPIKTPELEEVQNEKAQSPMDQNSPLDLSLKKTFPDVTDVSLIKRKESVDSTESYSQTSNDSRSPPRSLLVQRMSVISPTGSHSNESFPPHLQSVLPRQPQNNTERLSPLPPVLQADASVDKPSPAPGMPPPKLLKQGNNVCEECHIVFYKYDNYLAHKKHYCAFRRRQLSALAAAASINDHSSDDNNSNHSGINESFQTYQNEENNPKPGLRKIDNSSDHFRSVITKPPHSVFCCDACGVKFSTSDNLNAHQTYYCIKKPDSAMSKAAAARGDNSSSPGSLESPFSGPEEWKCNYCDVACSSYDTIRRHLLTHTELRGFRCIVCGYKGNTLRGMRSHACEHLIEGSSSIEEFVKSNVVAENGIMAIVPQHSDDESSENSSENRNKFLREETTETETKSILKKELLSTSANSNSRERCSSTPKSIESSPNKKNVQNATRSDESEDGASSPEISQKEIVNPIAFCDVVIKTENDQSLSDEDTAREGSMGSFIKFEPEPRQDSDQDKPSCQSTSVIRCASDMNEKFDGGSSSYQPSKRKSKTNTKQNPELKYCKSCDISFYHLSNFLAHKKFYCVSRAMQNCLQEVATVQ